MAQEFHPTIDAARTLVASQQFEQAIKLLESQDLADNPDAAELLGFSHVNLRNFQLAQRHYETAVGEGSATLFAVTGLADALAYQFKCQEAHEVLDRIPVERLPPPQRALVLASRGNTHALDFRLKEAALSYLEALSILPTMWTSWVSLGHIYSEQGRFDLAGGAYEKAYKLSKNHLTAHHLSVHYHLTGRHIEACELAEARLLEPKLHHQALGVPNWDGERVKSLAVFHEGGLGDLILYARYINVAAKFCDRLIFVVPERTHAMMQDVAFEKNVEVTVRTELYQFDRRASMMSLPLYLKLYSPELAPPPIFFKGPVLLPGVEAETPVVALSWFGDYKFPNDIARSMKLEDLRPFVLAHPEWKFVTFSPEPRAEEDIERAGLPITQVIAKLESVPKLMAQCSLAVTVDTAHAHLFGSLGVRTHLLLASMPGVYWGLDRPRTPYYKSIHLFRQKTPRDWKETVERLCAFEARKRP